MHTERVYPINYPTGCSHLLLCAHNDAFPALSPFCNRSLTPQKDSILTATCLKDNLSLLNQAATIQLLMGGIYDL